MAIETVMCALTVTRLTTETFGHTPHHSSRLRISHDSIEYAVLLSSRKVLVLDDPRRSIFKSLSLSSSLELKSLSLSSKVHVLENFRGLSRLSVSALCAGVSAGIDMILEDQFSSPHPWTSSPCPCRHPRVSSL